VRETLLAGGKSCRPLIAREGLSTVLVDPAIKLIREKGGTVNLGHELRQVLMAGESISMLEFVDDTIAVAPRDVVVLAVPPRSAASILPGLKTPTKFRAIVNAHFRYDPPANMPPMIGVIGGLIEWLFAFDQRLSITISNADRLVNMPREQLARHLARHLQGSGHQQ
jgi:hypothetical protein